MSGIWGGSTAAGTTTDASQYAQPNSGDTVVMNGLRALLFIDNPALLLALTVTLPANPVDGQRAIICAASAITVLTINAPNAIKGLVTTLALNGFCRYSFCSTANAWFRTG